MKYDSYKPSFDPPEPQVGDFISHKEPYGENTGIPPRMDLWVLEVRANGIVIAPVFQKQRLEIEPTPSGRPSTSYLGDGAWRAEDFVLWKRPAK